MVGATRGSGCRAVSSKLGCSVPDWRPPDPEPPSRSAGRGLSHGLRARKPSLGDRGSLGLDHGSGSIDPQEWLVFLALGIAWGSSYLFIKIGVETLTPLTLVASRLAIGAAVLAVVMVVARQALPRRPWSTATWWSWRCSGS